MSTYISRQLTSAEEVHKPKRRLALKPSRCSVYSFYTVLIILLFFFRTSALSAAVSPHISISPTTGTIGVTSFTETYSGFTPNGGITEYDTYPNGGITIYTMTANGSGSTSASFVLQSQTGNYSAYAVDNATGTRSNTITYTVNAPIPTISGYNWNTTPTAGQNFSGTVSGAGFVSGNTQVYFCGAGTNSCFQQPPAGVSVNSSSSLTLTNVNLTSAGTYNFYIQTSAGQSGRSSSFTVQAAAVAPTITGYNWSTTPTTGQNFSGTVSGTAFVSGNTQVYFCTVGTNSCFQQPPGGVAVNSSTSLALTNVNLTSAGTYNFYIQTSAGQSGRSSSFTVQAAPVAPTITGYNWSTTPTTGQNFSGSVNGTGFVSGNTQVYFCGAGTNSCFQQPPAGVSVNSSTTLTLTNVNLTSAGSYDFYVLTTAGQSNRATAFTVQAAPVAPTITGYNWSTTPTAGQNFSGTVSGTGFVSGNTQVYFCTVGTNSCFQQPPAGVSVNSSTSLTLTNVNLTSAGTYNFYIQTSAGQSGRSSSFTVQAAAVAPTITGYNWSTTPTAAQNFSGSVSGTGFVSGSTQVYFCGAGTNSCFQQPPAGVAVNSSTSLTLTNVNLTGAGSYDFYVQTSGGQSNRATAFTVQTAAVAPTITGYNWSATPTAGQNFSGTVSGTGFASGNTQVYFCTVGTNSCFQQPAAGVAVNSSTSLTLTNVNLTSAGTYNFYIQTSAGQSGRSSSFTVQAAAVAPTITGYNWSTTPTAAQNFSGSVSGTGFVSGSTQVYFCGAGTNSCFQQPPAGVAVNSSTSLTLTNVNLTGAGSYDFYVQTSGGQSNRATAFTVQAAAVAPTITGYNWSATPMAAQNFSGTVSGTGFASGNTQVYFCTVGTNSCFQQPAAGVAVNSSTSLTLTNVNLTSAGTYNFYIQTSAGQSGRSSSFTVQAAAVAPTITGYNWSTTPTAAQNFSGSVSGTGFVSGSTQVYFCGAGTNSCFQQPPAGVAVNSSTTLTLTNVNLTGAGSYDFYVQTSGGQSNRATAFTVQAAAVAPTITGYNWSATPTAAQNFSGSVSGTGFVSGSTQVYFCGAGTNSCFQQPQAGVAVNSSTSLTLTNVNLTGAGSYDFYVQTSGGQSNRATAFTVQAAAVAPTITGYNWSATPMAAQNFSGTVSGTGFVSGNTQVYFCGAGTNSCFQQPAAGVAVNSSTSLTLTNVNLTSAGSYDFYVQTSAGQSNRATAFTVQAVQGAPTITTYNWSATPTAAQNFSGTVSGTGFVSGNTQVYFCGAGTNSCFQQPPAGVAVNSSTSLTLTNVNLTSAGSYDFYVQTSAGQSNRATAFTVQAVQGAPTITTYNWSATPTAAQNFSGTVSGTGFVSGNTQVYFCGAGTNSCFQQPPAGVAVNSSTSLTLTNVNLTSAGSYDFYVQTSAGQSNRATAFTVQAVQGAPTITAYNWSATPTAAQNFSGTVSGTGFVSGSTQVYFCGAGTNSCFQQPPAGVAVNNSTSLTLTKVNLTSAGSYDFYVQTSAGQSGRSASFTVAAGQTGPASGTLKASPSTCQVTIAGGNCSISLPWTLQNTTSGLITVTDALGKQNVVNPVTGTSGTQPIPWLQALPQQYTFYLWDYTGGKQGAQLASVAVAATGPSASSSTPSVSVDPSRNPPGSTFTIYGTGLAAGQAAVYVQAPGASGTPPVGQVTVGSGGTFNYSYTTQPSNANGLYTVWAVDSSGKKSSVGAFTLVQPTPASIPTCQSNTTTSGCSADPINTATGNYTYQRTDLTLPGRGLPFAFTRTYNSQDGTPGPMGAGWTHSYMASLVQNSDSSVTIRMPDGQVVTFDPMGGAYISRFNNVYSTLQSPSPDIFVLITKNQVSYRFSSGQLTAVSDRNGNAIQLAYSNGILTVITDTVGRPFAVSADPAGRITQILGPAGRSLQYQYDGAGNLIAFTDSNGGTFMYTYDGAHEMLTAVDPVRNTFLTNTYDGSGHVATQADGMGNRWTYSYDANTLITTITDPNGKVSSHLHDSNFQLLRATDTLGKNDQYQYDSLGNRTSVQDRDGNTTRLNYDTNGNVIAATDAQSNIQAAAYDGQSNPLTRTDALGNQATFTYDSKGNLVTSVDPLGNKTSYAYNSSGQLTSKTDALGRTTQYSYDTSGNLSQVIDPLGNKTAYAYDPLGRRTSTTDANGFTSSIAYDANDNIVSVTDALGNTTEYTYDGNNNRTKVTDPRGKATAYAYDSNQKLVATTDAFGNKITNAYDKLRNLATVTDQRGNTTRYSYDSESRLTGSTDPLGKTGSYSYDAAGNRIQATDPLGNVTAYGYDSLNRQISLKDALGNQSATAYDSAGHIVKKTDPAGNVATYSYDSIGRQTSILDAAGGQVSFQYDNVGNRAQITDSRGKAAQFSYDGMNRLLTTTDPLGNSTKNQYDNVGNLVQVTDGNGHSKTYQYDADRRPLKITYSTGGSVQFLYDANGNRTKMVDLVGTSTYSYDDLNRLQNYTNPAGATLVFTYDAGSNRTAIQYPGNKAVQYAYDANNRISRVTDWNSMAASYSYDGAGRTSAVSYSNGLTSQYTYDALGQVLTIQHNTGGIALYSETTTWSPNRNPTSSNISGLAAPGLASENTTYTYNEANELASVTYGSPVFEKNGNVTVQPGFGGPTVFAYDLNNRATSISGPSVNATMKYFGDGRLAELDSAGAPHRYLLDPLSLGNRILAELDAAGGVQVAYVYGSRDLLSQVSGSQTYIYFHNLQRSTVALVDSTGSVKNSYRYDPFGQRLPLSSEQVANPFTFLGGFSVPSTGAYSVMSYRIYDSHLGRFSGIDPVYFKQSAVSPYIYAGQSPLGSVDPSGLIASTVSYSTPPSLLGPLPSSTPTPVVTTSNTTALRVQMAQAQADAEVSAAENDAYATAQQQVVDATVNAAQGVVDLFFCTGSLGIDSDACKGVVTSQVDNANFVIQNTVKNTTVTSAANCVTAGSDIVGVVGGLKSNLGGTQLYDAPFNLYGTNQLLNGKSNDVIAGCLSGPARAMGGH